MPAEYIEPFDFYKIFVNYFLGSQQLFPFAFMILLSIVCAYLNMSNKVFLLILVIGSVMFGFYMGEAIYFLIILLTGFVVFYIFSKIFR